jgi:osmotically-inducible protein OsmY
MSRALGLLVIITSLGASLPACALVDTAQKCGIKGCFGDADVTAHVKAALEEHPAFGWDVSVQTLNHVVYLHGLVNTDMVRMEIADVVKSVPGVTRVVNSIAVNNG